MKCVNYRSISVISKTIIVQSWFSVSIEKSSINCSLLPWFCVHISYHLQCALYCMMMMVMHVMKRTNEKKMKNQTTQTNSNSRQNHQGKTSGFFYYWHTYFLWLIYLLPVFVHTKKKIVYDNVVIFYFTLALYRITICKLVLNAGRKKNQPRTVERRKERKKHTKKEHKIKRSKSQIFDKKVWIVQLQ